MKFHYNSISDYFLKFNINNIKGYIVDTLPSLITGLSAPNKSSAVALLNAAKPSIGRYCTIKPSFSPSLLDTDKTAYTSEKAIYYSHVALIEQIHHTSLFSPFSNIRVSAYYTQNDLLR
jgi:hypothetical protein